MPHSLGLLSCLLVALAVASLGAGGRDAQLPEAARAGDQETVDALLAAGAAVNGPEPDGTTALHWAVYRDDAAMTSRLIEAGADVNGANENDATPLTLACTNANGAIVERLLRAGADPNTAAPGGAAPLIGCASSGAAAGVRMLLAHGADVNATDSWRGQTPLMWAAAENHAATIKVLLEGGAKIEARSSGDFTALMFAVRQDAREAMGLLVDAGADVNFIAPNGQSALRLAISNRHYTLAAALLDAGARPDGPDKQGNTPLHEVVVSRSPPRNLSNQFVAFSLSDPPSQLPSLELMRKLVELGADPNARTEPIPVVHERTIKGIYRPVIDNGMNMGGATPLLLAAQAVDVEAMRQLQALGVDPRLTTATSANNTALMAAAGLGFVEGARRYRPERDALEAVKLVVAGGIDVNATNTNGQTALHGAVYRAANSIIKYLVEAGAKTDVQDEFGRTPLELAEVGINQGSLIRRDSTAALLRELGAKSAQARELKAPDAR